MDCDYRKSYTFGGKHCFASIHLMDLFLVSLYTDKEWDLSLLNNTVVSKKKIESRTPGIVFTMRFQKLEKNVERKAVIFEEERHTPSEDGSISITRIISIFTKHAGMWNYIIERCIEKAAAKLRVKHPSIVLPKPEVSTKIKAFGTGVIRLQ